MNLEDLKSKISFVCILNIVTKFVLSNFKTTFERCKNCQRPYFFLKNTFCLAVCLCLLIIGSGTEAFWFYQKEDFTNERTKYVLPQPIEQESEIHQALSALKKGQEATPESDPAPQLRALSRRLKSLFDEETPDALREKGRPGADVIKGRDGTAIFIKDHLFDKSGILNKRNRGLYENGIDASFVYDESMKWLKANADILGMDNPSEELEKEMIRQDGLGIWHIRFKQVFKGINVFGAGIVLHYNPEVDVFCLTGRYRTTPDIISQDMQPIISEAVAVEKVRNYRPDFLDMDVGKDSEAGKELLCFFDPQGRAYLSWRIHVQKDPWLNRDVFVNARTGKILAEIDRLCQAGGPALGSGKDILGVTRQLNTYKIEQTYYLVDTSKDMFNPYTSVPPYYFDGGILCFDLRYQAFEDLANGGKIYFYTSIDNNWEDPYAVSAMYNASLAYDYFKETFGLESFDGEGRNIYLLSHFGQGYNNAGWSGHFIILGDGDGKTLYGIPAALDVITHELGHAVVDYKANFVYQGQSGSLHEAYADLFGVMSDRDDWMIGEDITILHAAVRDLAQPSRPDLLESLPKHMDNYEELPMTPEFDHGGVHRNVGIINRATYLIAESLGRSKTEQIYYRALDLYLTRYAMFVDLKLALAQSAQDLYGQQAKEVIEEAFSNVGIFSTEGSPQSDYEATQGGQGWILYVNPYDHSLWMVRLDGGRKQLVTYTPVKSRPAVTKNGKILFIDQANNIRGINIEGKDERVLSNAGIWKSIAISPNLDSFAVTIMPNVDDLKSAQKIYHVSLNDKEGIIKEINLDPPVTTQDGKGQIGYIFPGDMDFSFDGQYILFDAYHVLEWNNDHKIEYWDINRVRISDGLVDRPLPSLKSGLDIGNPTFAKGASSVMAYDLYDKDKGSYRTLVADTRTGENLLIREGAGLIGSCPSFSANNTHVIYHYFDNDKRFYLRLVELKEGFNSVKEGSDHALISEGKEVEGLLPTWFEFEYSNGQDGESTGGNGQDSEPVNMDSYLFQKDEAGCFISNLI